MGVLNRRFREGDVFIDYDFEEVMFRYEYATSRFYRKFYGEQSEAEVGNTNRLLNDAIQFGEEISMDGYHQDKRKP